MSITLFDFNLDSDDDFSIGVSGQHWWSFEGEFFWILTHNFISCLIMPYNQIMIVMEWVDNLHILTNRVDGALEALKLSIHYQCRENDGDIKQHGPESPLGISESCKGFREMSTGLKALNKSSLKKMKVKMGSWNNQEYVEQCCWPCGFAV